MKKHVCLVLIGMILFTSFPVYSQSYSRSESELEVIPDEAIRLRILANSDEEGDQQIKLAVRDAVNEQISSWVKYITNIEDARILIKENIHKVEQTVEQTLEQYDTQSTYQVAYQKEVPFPKKVYGRTVYPAGDYEAVLITLGEGVGENWWCVLFPPLCFLDFSQEVSAASPDDVKENKAEEADGEEEIEVKFFLWEWIERILPF